MYIISYVFCKKRHVFLNDNWCKIARFLRCNQEDSPNFLMDASAVVMELGLSMQKAESFFFHQRFILAGANFRDSRDHISWINAHI